MSIKKFPIEAGHIMQFARAIGDSNPIYSDSEYAEHTEVGSVIAPPTFLQACQHYEENFPLRPQADKPWFGSAKQAIGEGQAPGSEGGGIGLYAEHHYEYHQPVRPGDVLHSKQREGKCWQKQGKRGGQLTFQEYITEFYNQHDERVVTSTIIGVQTEHVVS